MPTLLILIATASALLTMNNSESAAYPKTEISNGLIRADIYLPDGQHGFYRGTRFDWSGVIYRLEAGGHNYYGPWFNRTAQDVHDFIYDGPDIVAGPCSASAGPVNEFAPVGYDEAKAGGTFLKIGVGLLRRDSAEPYDNYHLYELANGGKWGVHHDAAQIVFVQDMHDEASGFGYVYEKQLTLTNGKAEMVMTHRLRNIGKRAIDTTVYNHNFLVLDGQAPGPGLTISTPFNIRQPSEIKRPDLAAVRGQQILYTKELSGHDTFAMPVEGFGAGAGDNSFRIESRAAGAGMRAHTDKPLLRESLWSIRTVVAVEPFIRIQVAPGSEFDWTTTYTYYQLEKK